jgi:hypothetical protein
MGSVVADGETLIETAPQAPEGKRALCISILTLMISIPALIGVSQDNTSGQTQHATMLLALQLHSPSSSSFPVCLQA